MGGQSVQPRATLAAALVMTLAATTSRAAADAGHDAAGGVTPEQIPRLVLDAGRPDLAAPDPDGYRFEIHGEEQIRFQMQRSFLLVPTASAIAQQPGLVEQSIGQNYFLYHWLRLTPRLLLRDTLAIVAQADLVGLIAGERARDTRADATPRDRIDGLSNVQPRWLFAEWRLPFGLVRIGQQPNHWGMGILANDGDHPLLFGDYRYGSISERVLFATQPGGKDSDFHLAIAGDLVYRDAYARLTRGEQAYQGVLAAFYARGYDKLGLFAMLRHQQNDRAGGTPLSEHTEELDLASIDLHGRVAVPVPGQRDAFFVGEAEVATVLGSTNMIRTPAQALEGSKTQVRSYGGAAALGFVHARHATGFWRDEPGDSAGRAASARYLGKPDARGVPFGDFVANVEVGYASGDADPYDGTHRRFVFDPNHRVGLLLFDEVLRFATARSATAATDPLLTNPSRPPPDARLVPSNGGVFGAQYVNPTVIVRPRHWLDLKGGMVVAQATSDVVDPYRVASQGSYVGYRGGDPKKKDLGLELDAGFEARLPLDHGVKAITGAQGGVLFPGGALEDASGARLPPQWLVALRFGLVF